MQEIQKDTVSEPVETPLPGPGGIGMAVAIDWGLAVQILLMPFISIFFSSASSMRMLGQNSAAGNVVFIVLALLFGALLVWFGEMVRSGHGWARIVQLVMSSLLSLGGIISLVNFVHQVSVGNFWPLVTESILLVFSPLIVWRLSRPASANWFKRVTPAEARQRHGGKWIWFIALWAVVGGILQTIASLK